MDFDNTDYWLWRAGHDKWCDTNYYLYLVFNEEDLALHRVGYFGA